MNRHIWLAMAVAASACATSQAAEFPVDNAVTDARLDGIRGGFDMGTNLRASFALERTVLVNGAEALRTTISVPDIANITQAQAAALQDALRTTVVTRGAGGVTAPDLVPVGGGAVPASTGAVVTATLPPSVTPGLIVQNSLDNQAITATTTIDASVNTARMLESMRLAESVHDAVIQFRGN